MIYSQKLLNMGDESCTALRLRLMRKLAMSLKVKGKLLFSSVEQVEVEVRVSNKSLTMTWLLGEIASSFCTVKV